MSIFDTVTEFEQTAAVPALRAIVHSSMAQTFFSIRQHLREETRKERDEEKPSIVETDRRNMEDQDERGTEYIAQQMGFQVHQTPLNRALMWHKIYNWSRTELATLTCNNKWDMPMEPAEMLEFMATKARVVDPELLGEVAKVSGIREQDLLKMQEIQQINERKQLKKDIPAILSTFNSLGDEGYSDAFDELPADRHHQLGIKVIESLIKAKNGVLNRVLRTRKITELSQIPILDDAMEQLKKWVLQFENDNKVELREAIDNGVYLRSIEDVT